MRKTDDTNSVVAATLLQAIFGAGYILEPGDKILYFGCGEGGLVYRLRELGFDAYGFDIHNRVKLRHPDDIKYFGFIFPDATIDVSNTLVAPEQFHIPFADKMFDAVLSTSVIEHVMDLATSFAETARVLKSDGLAYHLYPNKAILIEPHIYVPLASYIKNKYWLLFWGLMGVRNEFQTSMTAKQVAENNAHYFQIGLIYRSRRELHELGKKYFGFIYFVDRLYYPHISKITMIRRRLRALLKPNRFKNYSQQLRMGSLLMRLPGQAAPAGQNNRRKWENWR